MHTKITLVYDTDQRKSIETIHEIKVNILIVFLAGLVVKIHDLSHLTSLVVASKHNNFIRVFNLQSHQ